MSCVVVLGCSLTFKLACGVNFNEEVRTVGEIAEPLDTGEAGIDINEAMLFPICSFICGRFL